MTNSRLERRRSVRVSREKLSLQHGEYPIRSMDNNQSDQHRHQRQFDPIYD